MPVAKFRLRQRTAYFKCDNFEKAVRWDQVQLVLSLFGAAVPYTGLTDPHRSVQVNFLMETVELPRTVLYIRRSVGCHSDEK